MKETLIPIPKNILNKETKSQTITKQVGSKQSLFTTEINIFPKRISQSSKQQFYHDLKTLLEAGMDINTCMELIKSNQKRKSNKRLFDKIHNSIINGDNLSTALKEHQKFTPYEVYTIRIGEETGQLIEILHELSSFYTEKIRLRKKMISSLSYPMIVLITAFFVIWFMISFIVPMFEEVFKRFDQELPTITKLIIEFAHGFKTNLSYFSLMLVLILSTILMIRKKEIFRRISSKAILNIPIIGSLVREINLSRFSLCMFLLLKAHVPLHRALELIHEMIRYYPIESAIGPIRQDIFMGTSLHHSMEKFPVFDKRMISMVKVAEETNKLDIIFQRLKDQYNLNIEQKTSILGSLIEPVLIIFIGFFIGLILIAMYMPMFMLGSGIGG